MVTHTADTAQTWRDLAGQLTPHQITDLDYWERRGADASADTYRKYLIANAREYIESNQRDAELSARIAPPECAWAATVWDHFDSLTKLLCRSLQWATFDAGPTKVDIDGLQDETGAVNGPHLSVYGLTDGGRLTPDDARRLAAALTKAAAALESLR